MTTTRARPALTYDTDFDERNLNPSINKIALRIPRGARVLEIGCASGYLSRHLKEHLDCQVVAVESDATAAAVAAQWVPVHVLDVERADLRLLGGSFDVVVMADVLEHLRHPSRLLSRLKSLLAAGGTVLISLPNVAHYSVRLSLLRGRFDYSDSGLLDRTHLRFFTLHTARALLHDSGYDVLSFDMTMSYTRLGRFLGPSRRLYRPALAAMKLAPNLFGYQFVFEAAPRTA
jgi:methionine biosynthesis protein MetW